MTKKECLSNIAFDMYSFTRTWPRYFDRFRWITKGLGDWFCDIVRIPINLHLNQYFSNKMYILRWFWYFRQYYCLVVHEWVQRVFRCLFRTIEPVSQPAKFLTTSRLRLNIKFCRKCFEKTINKLSSLSVLLQMV